MDPISFEIRNRMDRELERKAEIQRSIRRVETAIAHWDIENRGRAGLRRLQATLHSLQQKL